MLKHVPAELRNRHFPKTTTQRSPRFEYKMDQEAEETGKPAIRGSPCLDPAMLERKFIPVNTQSTWIK